uniref:Uncharacterized protein n=1 Tax=Parascaris univalens TaxID=6257 RepID=A0A915CJ22_PARUN
MQSSRANLRERAKMIQGAEANRYAIRVLEASFVSLLAVVGFKWKPPKRGFEVTTSELAAMDCAAPTPTLSTNSTILVAAECGQII